MDPHETISTGARPSAPQGPTLGALIDAYLQDYQVGSHCWRIPGRIVVRVLAEGSAGGDPAQLSAAARCATGSSQSLGLALGHVCSPVPPCANDL